MYKKLINNLLTLIILFSLAIVMNSCNTQKKLEDSNAMNSDADEDMERVLFDTMVINGNDPDFASDDSAEIFEYRSSAKRDFDLIHTQLSVAFDFEKQHVLGKAKLTFTPLFYPQNMLVLDAKNFEIKSITTQGNKSLKHEYDGQKLSIILDKTYTRKDTLTVWIDYIAKPNDGPSGGSDAITSDKGLYFINPDGSDKTKPTQIWTQGETESSSRWFPTIDKPNERCTQEISITVPQKFTTLSNGIKTASVKSSNDMRTDTWVMDKPHAPYLFMMAIGEYAWVEDKWKNIPLYYLVEPEFAPYAKEIYNHTPEMLEYFSNVLDYPYPWDKFAQVTARDYVSGAMENTTAVIFGDFIQKTDRDLIDDDNDAIVAHEMFHHWFGDLVTCESWSNLTLNEGFANYAEYLWFEHKYGVDRADMHRMNELQGYLSDVGQGNVHPLIDFHYADKEKMFDSHSYNKGGLVLHMLRSYVGDEAFFASLNYYLKKYAYTAVEVDELRMAFEDVTGEDLHWFFDQWYLKEGHPIINVDYIYNSNNQSVRIIVEQIQEYDTFRIPFDVAIYNADGKIQYERIWVDKKLDTFVIQNILAEPLNVVLDGKDDILATIEEKKSDNYNFAELMYSPNAGQRLMAMYKLTEGEGTDFNRLASIGLRDENYLVQQTAVEVIPDVTNFIEKLKGLALNGKHKDLRSVALVRLSESELEMLPLLEEVLNNEKAPGVLAIALSFVAELDLEKAKSYIPKLEKVNSEQLLGGLGAVYAKSVDSEAGKWFLEKIETKSIYTSYQLFGPFVEYLMALSPMDAMPYVEKLYELGTDVDKVNFLRFMSVASMYSLAAGMEGNASDDASLELISTIKKYVADAKSKETDPLLLAKYAEFED